MMVTLGSTASITIIVVIVIAVFIIAVINLTRTRAGRHPEVLATKAAAARHGARENERSTVPRQGRGELAERRVHRWPEALRGGPGIPDTL